MDTYAVKVSGGLTLVSRSFCSSLTRPYLKEEILDLSSLSRIVAWVMNSA